MLAASSGGDSGGSALASAMGGDSGCRSQSNTRHITKRRRKRRVYDAKGSVAAKAARITEMVSNLVQGALDVAREICKGTSERDNGEEDSGSH